MNNYVYQVVLSNDVDNDGHYKAEVLVNAVPSKWFFRRDRDEAFEAAKAWVEWHKNHDASVEMIEL